MPKLQTCELRLFQLLLLGLSFWLMAPELRGKYSSLGVVGVIGVLVVLLLLESTRSLCRTPGESATFLAQICWTLCSTLVQFAARGFKPKFPKWTLRFELVRGVMRDASDMFGHQIVDADQAPVFRWHSELFGSFLGWFVRRQHGFRLEPVRFNGLEHLWLKASRTKTDSKRLVVLFYHGGGYAVLSPRMYIPFCCELLSALKLELSLIAAGKDVVIDIFLANYRKVPECPFPVPADDAVAMYEYLLQREKLHPSQIILAGDSAGGGLVLSTLLRVRDGKPRRKPRLPLPLAAIVACPLADLTGDEDIAKRQHCVLSPSIIAASIEGYRPPGKGAGAWGEASPVHCNLGGLPPLLLQAATLDYLFEQSLRLAQKAKADGVTNWDVDVHEGVTHVFMVFPAFLLPYARVGVQRMASFAAKQFLNGIEKKCSASLDVENAATGKRTPSTAA
jgi:acetyl esterase/lipase